MQTEQLEELKNISKQLDVFPDRFSFRKKDYPYTDSDKADVLTALLYAECYAKKISFQLGMPNFPAIMEQDSKAFIDRLSANNSSKGFTDGGWTVRQQLTNGLIEVSKGPLSKIIGPGQYQQNGHAHLPMPQQTITILLPKEDRLLQQGFYYVYSNEMFSPESSMLRIYWNIDSDGAPKLVKAVTRQLNYYHIPFLFKCLNNPLLYSRRDACVLYISKKHYTVCSWLLENMAKELEGHLQEDVPLFTFKYTAGIGIAENPLSNESFGMNRMALLAKALIAAYQSKKNTRSSMASIKNMFSDNGIDLNRPFLNKGSKQPFQTV